MAEEQVVHPVPQAVQRSTAVAEAAVVKNPVVEHSQAVLAVPTAVKPVAQVEHFSVAVQVKQPGLHAMNSKVVASW